MPVGELLGNLAVKKDGVSVGPAIGASEGDRVLTGICVGEFVEIAAG